MSYKTQTWHEMGEAAGDEREQRESDKAGEVWTEAGPGPKFLGASLRSKLRTRRPPKEPKEAKEADAKAGIPSAPTCLD